LQAGKLQGFTSQSGHDVIAITAWMSSDRSFFHEPYRRDILLAIILSTSDDDGTITVLTLVCCAES
jgi:hypothetical protein